MPKTATTTRTSHARPSRRVIPLDDEPLTPADLKAIEAGRQAFARGDYCTLDELKADLARDVARQRRRPRAKSA
jgi:hypothetical protein